MESVAVATDTKKFSRGRPLLPILLRPLLTNMEEEHDETTECEAPADPLAVDVSELCRIREKVCVLAASETIDKTSALDLTRLFHDLETLLHRECHSRDRALTELRAELQRTRLQIELDRLARQKTMNDVQIQQLLTTKSSRTRRF